LSIAATISAKPCASICERRTLRPEWQRPLLAQQVNPVEPGVWLALKHVEIFCRQSLNHASEFFLVLPINAGWHAGVSVLVARDGDFVMRLS
jgi:hypothetical protein